MIWENNKNYWVNKDGSISYECSFCQNCYTESEGFNLKTNQCKGCDEYDKEEPIRIAERKKQQKWWEEEGRHIEANLRLKYGPKY